MTLAKEAAGKLAEQIFARVEDDRVLIKEHITEILEDGLILFAAKNAQPTATTITPRGEVMDAAIKLIKMTLDDTAFLAAMPVKLRGVMSELYEALIRTGWMP